MCTAFPNWAPPTDTPYDKNMTLANIIFFYFSVSFHFDFVYTISLDTPVLLFDSLFQIDRSVEERFSNQVTIGKSIP